MKTTICFYNFLLAEILSYWNLPVTVRTATKSDHQYLH
jgi:hypothetical protein